MLLQDDLDTDLSLNDNSGYNMMIKFVPIVVKKMIVEKHVTVLINLILGQLLTVGVSLKVRPSLVNNLIKGKVLSNTSNKPAKVAKLDYTSEQISQLKSQMGISSMAHSINTLTGLMQTLVNANKDSLTQSDNNNNVQQSVVSQDSNCSTLSYCY